MTWDIETLIGFRLALYLLFVHFMLACLPYNLTMISYYPLQVESIVLSIISMLSSPNDESPANVEAAVMSCYICHLFQLIF